MNYLQLQQAIAGYLHRDDMAEQIKTGIALAGARIGRDLRHRANTQTTVFTASQDGVAFSPQYLREISQISYPAGTFAYQLQVVSEATWGEVQSAGGSGKPTVYSYLGGIIKVAPVNAETQFQITGWFQPPPLVNDSDTNPVLDYAPQLYVYAALMESFFWSQDGELTEYARAQYEAEIALLNVEAKSEKTGINPRMIRSR